MTKSCYDCPFRKTVYRNTLKGQEYCTRYMKIIPVSHLAQCFWCDYNAEQTKD